MNRRRSPLLTLGAVLSLGLLSSTMAVAEGYYVGSVCNPQTPYEPSWYTDGPNLINGSAGIVNVRCGLPNNDTLTDITFSFAVQRNGAGTSTCQGFARNSSGNSVWVSSTTSHSSGGLSIVSTNNGPAGNDTLNYATFCTLAAGHSIERIRLF